MIGYIAFTWAIAAWLLSATVRFKWTLIFNGACVGAVACLGIGMIAYYSGKHSPGGEPIIEGPEFFGVAFAIMLSAVWAVFVITVGAALSWARKGAVALVRSKVK